MPVVTPRGLPGPEAIAWSIDGVPVNLAWDSCSMVAPGGYDALRGTITGHLQTHRVRKALAQGMQIRGVRPNGRVLYQGYLISRPKILNDVAYIEAGGYQDNIRRRNTRLPYVISDASQWSTRDESPLNYAVNNQKIDTFSKNDSLGWKVDGNTSYATGNDAGYGIYVPGHKIQRIRCTIIKTGDDANFDMKFYDADDLGALGAAVSTKTMGAGNPSGTDFNIPAVNHDTVVVTIEYTAGGGMPSGGSDKFMLRSLEACVIADDDDWITSDVVSDVASRMSFADNVSDGSTDIGGLDWTGSWDELLTYMANIEDWTWLVEEDRTKNGREAHAMLTFRDWGHNTWTTNMDLSDATSLTVAPTYNQVVAQFERPAGVPQHKVYSVHDFNDLDDPTPGFTFEYPDPIVFENPQRGTTRADTVAEKLLRRVSQLRLVGNVKVAGLAKGRPYDMKAGDKLKVDKFHPDAPPQRISQITYNADGTADCTLERSWDIGAMLFRLTNHRRRTTPHGHGAGHRN
jgi:hypothetical protein